MPHCGCRGECTCIIKSGSENVHVYGAGALDDPYLIAVDPGEGGGVSGVSSVNGETGVVTLSPSDVGASEIGHTHPAGDVVSGTLAVARIGTGTPAAGKYVDGGTGAWTALPEGGGASPSVKFTATRTGTSTNLTASSWVTYPLDNVVENVGGGSYDAGTYIYTVPEDGLYLCLGQIRIQDNSASRSVALAIGTTNADGPHVLWEDMGHNVANGRAGRQYTRLASLTAGDQIRMYIYSDVQTFPTMYNAGAAGQSMTIVKIGESTTGSGAFVSLARSTNQSINSGSVTEVLWTSEVEDVDAFHDLVTNTGRLTVPTGADGVYFINATLGYAANATGLRSVLIRVNGSDVVNVAEAAMTGGTETIVQGTVAVRLAATDYVTVHAYQDSGGSLDLVATRSSVVMASMGGTGGGTGSGLPAGIASPDDYTAIDGAVINAGTSTTGFYGQWATGTTTVAGVPCVNTNIGGNEGAIEGGLQTISPAQSTTGKMFVLVDIAWAPLDGYGGNLGYWHMRAYDGASFTGNYYAIELPLVPASTWITVVIPVSSLSEVESISLINDRGPYWGGGAKMIAYWSNIRWANQTEADIALQEGSVLISPTYVPGVTQEVNQPLLDKTRVNLDPDVAWIDGFGGVRHVREWGVPEDGLTECSGDLSRAFGAMRPGQTLVFPPKGLYWVDRPLRAPAGVRIEFNGATLFTRVLRGGDNNVQDPMIFVTGQNIQLIRPHLVGYREQTPNGSAFSTVAGSPSNSGNNKLLDAQGESVHYLHPNSIVPWYARYPLIQFPTAVRSLITATYPTFALGNAWVFTLSDSAQVASDCVLEAVNTITGAVEATRTLTLTGTPTEYVLAWEPTDLEAQVSVRVRKATATANTITLASARLFGYTEYSSANDSANAIVIQGAQNVLIDDWLIEGAITDAIDSTSTANKNIVVRNGTSRACSRQGVSLNLGSGTFENLLIIGANRSGVDIEPYGLDWLVTRLVLRDLRIIGCQNWGIAMNNWAGISGITIDGIVEERCMVGTLLGGGRDGTITNITGTGAVYISGQRLRGGNITCGYFSITSDSKTYAPAGTGFGQTTAGASNSNTAALNSVAGLTVGQRVLLTNVTPTTTDPYRKITAINGLDVTFDGDPVTWGAFYTIFYDPSVVYQSRDNSFTGVTITTNTPPNVTGASNKVADVRGLGRHPINQNLAVWEVQDGYLGTRDSVRDIFVNQFGRSFLADRGTEPPFIYGGLNLRGQALSGLKGISGDRRTVSATVADATAGGGRGYTSTIDLGFRGLSVVLHLGPWVSGAGTLLSVHVETSQNNSNWYPVASFQDTYDSGLHQSMVVRFCERYLRARYFLSGTSSPAGSFSVTAAYSLPTNNTSGTWTGASSSSATVAFPSKGGPEFNLFDVSANAASGSLSQSTTYYYRIGARTREAGPATWEAEDSVALGAGQTAVTVYFERWLSDSPGLWNDGMSILRGTSAGTYTQRFDVMAKAGVELFTLRADGASFIDKGTHIAVDNALYFPNFPDTYPTLSPKLTATDESGFEVDNTYRVFTMPAYTSITKRADGFDVTFASALTTFDWFIVR